MHACVCVYACMCVCVAKPVAVELRCHATALIYTYIIKYIYNISIMPLSLRIMCFLENVFLLNLEHILLYNCRSTLSD